MGLRLGLEAELSAHELAVLRSDTSRVTVLDSIEGSSFAATQTALGVFQRRLSSLDLTLYKIQVVGERDSIVVIFTDKDREIGTLGSPPGRPGFEVELNASDLRVVRSHFIR